jgi:hypothetical protein
MESNMVVPVLSSMCQSAAADANTTTADEPEEAVEAPATFLAVTVTWSLLPTSVDVGV